MFMVPGGLHMTVLLLTWFERRVSVSCKFTPAIIWVF